MSRTQEPAVVSHYNVQRTIDIYANTQGRDLGGVASDIAKITSAARKRLPKGSTMVTRGQVATMHSSFVGLGAGLAFAIVLVYLLIVINFQSWSEAFTIITALPAALAGIVWVLYLTHTTLSLRLTAGSFRELHWHTADEWAIMLDGNARVSVLNPDGTIFLDDVGKGDLWYFPAGYPHSIQGLGPDGCEFLLVFDEGMFSEDNTFLLSEWMAHTPTLVLSKNLGLNKTGLAKLPTGPLYIFQADLPKTS